MKKYLYVILLSLILNGCSNFGTNFIIENKTSSKIDSLVISNGFNSVAIDKLNINEKTIIFLDFTKNKTNADGNYSIKYKLNNKYSVSPFGYYTNGIPLSEEINIQILEDTIIIKDILK